MLNGSPSNADQVDQLPTPDGEENASDQSASAAFETDSTFSGDESDMGDDSFYLLSDTDIFAITCDWLQSEVFNKEDAVLAPILNPMKQDLIESIMKEFWTIFNHEWSTNVRNCASGPSGTTSSSSIGHNSGSHSGNSNNSATKRTRENDGDRSPDDNNDDGGPPKRPRNMTSSETVGEETAKFACPYRKNNPRKYTHRTRIWRSCAMSSFDTVARLKWFSPKYLRKPQAD